jgi:hypothetical protein
MYSSLARSSSISRGQQAPSTTIFTCSRTRPATVTTTLARKQNDKSTILATPTMTQTTTTTCCAVCLSATPPVSGISRLAFGIFASVVDVAGRDADFPQWRRVINGLRKVNSAELAIKWVTGNLNLRDTMTHRLWLIQGSPGNPIAPTADHLTAYHAMDLIAWHKIYSALSQAGVNMIFRASDIVPFVSWPMLLTWATSSLRSTRCSR